VNVDAVAGMFQTTCPPRSREDALCVENTIQGSREGGCATTQLQITCSWFRRYSITSILFRIWIWACSDMGSTAPTNFPDSISMSEGIASPDSFSRLLLKLAKNDLQVESFSAYSSRYLSRKAHEKVSHSPRTMSATSRHTESAYYLIVFTRTSTDLRQIGEGEALQDSETLPH